MTRKETLIVSSQDKSPENKNEKEEENDYKKGLSEIELDDFLSYLDDLKIEDNDKDKDGLSTRGGGGRKGAGHDIRKNRRNLYTAKGINFSCQIWTEEQRKQRNLQFYNQLNLYAYPSKLTPLSDSLVKDEGQDVVDGPGVNSASNVQNTGSALFSGSELEIDAAPLPDSIDKKWIDNIPPLNDFFNKEIFENQRSDALTPYSNSTKSPQGSELDDIMDVITDEEASRSPLSVSQSPEHIVPPVSPPEIPHDFEFQNFFGNDKFLKEPGLFDYKDESTNLSFSVFSENSNSNFTKFSPPMFPENDFVTHSISEENRIHAEKERLKHGLVPYMPDEVPAKKFHSSSLLDRDSHQDLALQVDPEIAKLITIDAEGDSILHSCIIAGISTNEFQDLLDLLSSHGVLKQIIDKQNGMWRTALFLAVLEKRTDLVDCLLLHHADPNIQGKIPYDLKKDLYDLRSPLHLVAEMGDDDIDLLKLLLDCDDLEMDSRSESDRLTALHIALLTHKVDRNGKIIRNCSESIKTLIEYGADVNIVEDRSSRTPIMLAIETADFQLVKDFMSYVSDHDSVRWALQEVTRAGDTPLHLAAGLRLCKDNKIKMLRLLVRKGADTNVENNIKESPEDVATKEVWRDLFKVGK